MVEFGPSPVFLLRQIPCARAILVAKRFGWSVAGPPCPLEYIPPPQAPSAPEHMRKRLKRVLALLGKLSPHRCLSSRRFLEAGKNATCHALSRCCLSTHIALKHDEASPSIHLRGVKAKQPSCSPPPLPTQRDGSSTIWWPNYCQ